MAAMPQRQPTLVRCRECQQAVARITGKTIRPLGDISVQDGRVEVTCPVCGTRRRITREDTADAA